MPPQDITLRSFQQHIRNRYYNTDNARGTPATFMWLMEEVGELATALQKTAATKGESETGADQQAIRANLEEEFADVLAWLCTLANINDVDLVEAVTKKYLTDGGPEGYK